MRTIPFQDPAKPIRRATGIEAIREGERSLLMAFGESGGLVLGAPAVAMVVGLALVATGESARGSGLMAWLWVVYAASACLLAVAPRPYWQPALMAHGLLLQGCLIGAAWLQGWGLNGGTLMLLPPAMLVLALLLPQLQVGISWACGVAGLICLWVWHQGILVEAGPLLLTQAPAGSRAILTIGAHTVAMVVGLLLGEQLRRRMRLETEHRTRYQDFFQQVPVGVIVHRNGKVLDANQTAADLLGFKRGQDLHDESVLAVAADEATKEVLLSRLERLKSTAPGVQLEPAVVMLQASGGRTLECRIVCSRVELADGPANIAMFTDETARMAMEASLRWSLSVQERLVASSPLAIAITQQSTQRMVSSNAAAAELTGHSVDDLLEMSPEQRRILWPAREQVHAVYADLAEQGVSTARDLTMRTGRGDMRQTRVWASSFKVDEEDYVVWFGQDVTQQEAERAAREAMMERARAEAEAASRAKSAFLANTSHELRTPLNAIIGLSQLAVAPSATDAQRLAFLKQIQESSRSLLQLVSEVLDVAKIEAGALDLETLDFDLTEVLQEVAHTYEELSRQKGLRFELNLPWSGTHLVTGDPTRLRQVVQNLLSNALKFTREGWIRTSVRRLSHTHVCIEVQDTGPGVPEDVQELIFQPFAQADTSTTRRYGGTGLGLSIVRELCSRMGGHCDVSSVPGQGSRFWCIVELPSVAPTPRIKPVSEALGDVLDSGPAQRHQPLTNDDAAVNEGLAKPEPEPEIVPQNLVPQGGALETRLEAGPEAGPEAGSEAGPEAEAEAGLETSHEARLEGLPQSGQEEDHHGAAPPVEAPVSLPGRRILVVEDNPINRMIVTLMLEQRGAQAITAHDGRQALGMLEQMASAGTLPDAVLMDMQMPEMDGKTATRAIRTQPALAHLPVIALTAGVTVEEREEAMASGVDDYLTKPVDIDLLVTRLAARLESTADQPRLDTSVRMS